MKALLAGICALVLASSAPAQTTVRTEPRTQKKASMVKEFLLTDPGRQYDCDMLPRTAERPWAMNLLCYSPYFCEEELCYTAWMPEDGSYAMFGVVRKSGGSPGRFSITFWDNMDGSCDAATYRGVSVPEGITPNRHPAGDWIRYTGCPDEEHAALAQSEYECVLDKWVNNFGLR